MIADTDVNVVFSDESLDRLVAFLAADSHARLPEEGVILGGALLPGTLTGIDVRLREVRGLASGADLIGYRLEGRIAANGNQISLNPADFISNAYQLWMVVEKMPGGGEGFSNNHGLAIQLDEVAILERVKSYRPIANGRNGEGYEIVTEEGKVHVICEKELQDIAPGDVKHGRPLSVKLAGLPQNTLMVETLRDSEGSMVTVEAALFNEERKYRLLPCKAKEVAATFARLLTTAAKSAYNSFGLVPYLNDTIHLNTEMLGNYAGK